MISILILVLSLIKAKGIRQNNISLLFMSHEATDCGPIPWTQSKRPKFGHRLTYRILELAKLYMEALSAIFGGGFPCVLGSIFCLAHQRGKY